MTYANGAIYVGDWLKGMREGHGKFTDATGAVYDGEWVANKKQGHVRLELSRRDELKRTGNSYIPKRECV